LLDTDADGGVGAEKPYVASIIPGPGGEGRPADSDTDSAIVGRH
jgi:hypothetical protein